MATFEILQPLLIIRVIESTGDTYLLRPMTKVNGVWVDTDLSARSQEVQDFAVTLWTQAVKDAYVAAMATQPVYPNPDPNVDTSVPPPPDPFADTEPPDKSVRYFETTNDTFPVTPQVGDLWYRQDQLTSRRRVTDASGVETWVPVTGHHDHEVADITGLQTALDLKADSVYYYTRAETEGLLDAKADLSAFIDYYTKVQVDVMFDGISTPSNLNEIGTYVYGLSKLRHINAGELVPGSSIAICGVVSRKWVYVLTGTWRIMGGHSPWNRRSLFLKVY